MSDKERQKLCSEIRYTQRLAQRSARLWWRIDAVGTLTFVLGSSVSVANFVKLLPPFIGASASVITILIATLMVCLRPAQKASLNEADVRKYDELLVLERSGTSTQKLAVLLAKAHQTDAPEIETLRDVAYNDVCSEINRADYACKLSVWQRTMAIMA